MSDSVPKCCQKSDDNKNSHLQNKASERFKRPHNRIGYQNIKRQKRNVYRKNRHTVGEIFGKKRGDQSVRCDGKKHERGKIKKR